MGRLRARMGKNEGGLKMAENIKVILTEAEVDARIKSMGEQISRDYAGKQVHLVCVLKGGSFFKIGRAHV